MGATEGRSLLVRREGHHPLTFWFRMDSQEEAEEEEKEVGRSCIDLHLLLPPHHRRWGPGLAQ